MNCLVIGVAGFIGRRLGSQLSERGHEVLGVDLRAGIEAARSASALRFPVQDCDVRAELPDLSRIDAVFYLAQSSRYREFPSGAADLFDVNVGGALRAATAAARAGARFFCYASTGNVYAPSFAPLKEKDPLRRDQAYALSKIAGEEALALYADAMKVTCTRLFGVFGPAQRGTLVPNLARRVLAGEPVELAAHPSDPTDDDGLRISLAYVDDVTACLSQLAERALSAEELPFVLNVAGPEPVSIRRLAQEIGKQAGVAPRFRPAPRARDADLIADITSLRSLTRPRFTPLVEALARTLAELRA